MLTHDFLQGFLACTLMLFPLWVIIDVIYAIKNHFTNNKEDDE